MKSQQVRAVAEDWVRRGLIPYDGTFFYAVVTELGRLIEPLRAGRFRALLRARRYLRWARRTEIALAAYQRTERATWEALARVTVVQGSLPEAAARVADALINTGIEADILGQMLRDEIQERERLEAELAQARMALEAAARLPLLNYAPPWEEL